MKVKGHFLDLFLSGVILKIEADEVMPKTKTSKPVLNQQPSDICKPTAKLPTKDGIQLNSQPTNIQPTNSGDQRTNYRNTDRSKTTFEPEVQYNIDPVKLKERGNLEFKNGDYMQAMELYSEAIKAQKSKTKTDVSQSRDLAVLYGNRSECFLKMSYLDKAMEDAMESVSYDGHWFKAHMKVGKVLAAKNNHEGALQAYTNALNELSSEKFPEKSQREILALYCVQYMNLDEKYKYPVNKKVTTFKVSTHLWALVTYDLISRNSWDVATFPYIQFKCDPKPTNVVANVDLQPFCSLHMVTLCGWCVDLIEYFLVCGSDYNTLTTCPGDRYIHATVKLAIASGSFDLLQYILSTVMASKMDQNLLDDKGNTALHTITRDSEVNDMTRIKIMIMLLKAEVNPLIKNLDGKYAIMYLPKVENRAIEILQNVMRQQEDIEKQIKQQKLQQQRQQEAQKKQTQEQIAGTNTAYQQGRQPQQKTSNTSDGQQFHHINKTKDSLNFLLFC